MLYIVTPVSRAENIEIIFNSIKNQLIPKFKDFVKWHLILDPIISSEEHVEIYKLLTDKILTGLKISLELGQNKKAFVGHAHRNFFIKIYNFQTEIKNIIKTDYAYFLDDDTILHPEFLETVLPVLETEKPEIIVFGQNNKDNSVRLLPSKENIKVGYIDMGQYVFKINSLPNNIRFKEDDYCADGIFIEELYKHHGSDNTIVINKQLSFYNFLR